jgi:hypothetical protein
MMSEKQPPPDGRVGKRSCPAAAAKFLLALAWLALSIPLAWPAIAAVVDVSHPLRRPELRGTNYLIVTAPALQKSAEVWAEYRRSTGYIPKILSVSEDDADFLALREKIQEVYFESGRPYPFFVLLLGHAHPGSSRPEAFLPSAAMETGEYSYYLSGAETVASDSMYAAQGDTVHLLPMAIGRIPAHDDLEGLRVLARVKQYETQPPSGEGRIRIDLIASDSGFGPRFDRLVEMSLEYLVTNYLPEYYRWRILYGNPDNPYYFPAGQFPREIADRFNDDSLLVAYIGHGLRNYLGPVRTPQGEYVEAFTSQDLTRVHSAERSIMMLIGCMIGEFDFPGDETSLAESLLLQQGGAPATYAASRITSPEGNTILIKDLLTGMLVERIATAGEWVRRAESGFVNPGSDRALWMRLGRLLIPKLYSLSEGESQGAAPDIPGEAYYNLGQHAYNLFGDPAMRIAYSLPDLTVRPSFPWLAYYPQVDFSGSGKLPPGTEVAVQLLAPPGRQGSGEGASENDRQADDPPLAIQSVLVGEGEVFSGRLELPDPLPSGKYILRASAEEGETVHVGSRIVYLGGPPVGAVVFSPFFWWILLSLILLWNLRFDIGRAVKKILAKRSAARTPLL